MELKSASEEALTLEVAQLLASCIFVPFATLQGWLGLDYSDIIRLKTPVETLLRIADDDVRVVSLMHLDPPGLHLVS